MTMGVHWYLLWFNVRIGCKISLILGRLLTPAVRGGENPFEPPLVRFVLLQDRSRSDAGAGASPLTTVAGTTFQEDPVVGRVDELSWSPITPPPVH